MNRAAENRSKLRSSVTRLLVRRELTVIAVMSAAYLALAASGSFDVIEGWIARNADALDELLALLTLMMFCAVLVGYWRRRASVCASASLGDAEKRYRLLVEQLPGAVYTDIYRPGNADLLPKLLSPQIEPMLGYSVEEWMATPTMWDRLLHPDDHDRVTQEVAEAARRQTPFRSEYRLIARDGRIVWIREDASIMEMHDGGHLWQGVMHDITKEKAEAASLEEARARFQALIEYASEATIVVDASGRALYESPSVQRLFGKAYVSMAEDLWSQCHPADRARVDRAFAECSDRPGTVVTSVHRLRHADGHWVWIEAIIHNLLEEPAVGGIVINARDISEQRSAAEQLQVYADVFNEISFGLYVFHLEDPDDALSLRLMEGNAAAASATGIPEPDVVGTLIGEAFPALIDTPIPEMYRRVATNGQGHRPPDVHYTDDRVNPGVFSVYAFPLPDRCVGVAFENVTERVQTEVALRRSLDDLSAADRERRRLLEHLVVAQEHERERIASDIHDDPIQNMTAVQLRLGSMVSTLDERSPHRDALMKAQQAVGSSIKRLRSMLFELRPRALDSGHLLDAVREYLANVREFDDDTKYVLEEDLEVHPSSAEATIAYRLLQEAVANARKHSHASIVRVRIETRPGHLVIHVADDGVGFGIDAFPSPMPGHMGLSSMRQRAEMAGGTIQVTSIPGSGATVVAEIPLGVGPSAEARGDMDDHGALPQR